MSDLKTLVKDADDIKLMLNKLASAMEDVLKGESDDEDDRAELSPRQIERLDEIDNAMYRFLLVLLERDEDEFDWDMVPHRRSCRCGTAGDARPRVRHPSPVY